MCRVLLPCTMVASRALPLGVYFVIVFPAARAYRSYYRNRLLLYTSQNRTPLYYRVPGAAALHRVGAAGPDHAEPGITDALEVSRLSALQNLNCVVRARE